MARKALFGLAALLCAANALRLALSLQQAETLPDLAVALRPEASALIGGVWAVLFCAAALALVARARWAGAMAFAAVAAYHAHLWINRAVFARSDEGWQTAGFNVLLTAVALAVAGWLAWRVDRARGGSGSRPASAD